MICPRSRDSEVLLQDRPPVSRSLRHKHTTSPFHLAANQGSLSSLRAPSALLQMSPKSLMEPQAYFPSPVTCKGKGHTLEELISH